LKHVEWEHNGRKQEHNEPVVKEEEENLTRKIKKVMRAYQLSQGRLMLSQVIMTDMFKRIMKNC